MTEQFSRFDAAEYLSNEAEMAAYLEACAEEGDTELMLAALGDIARARSIASIARETRISREGLYKALSGQGNPSFANVVKIARAVGFKIVIAPSKKDTPEVKTKTTRATGTQAPNTPKAASKRATPRRKAAAG